MSTLPTCGCCACLAGGGKAIDVANRPGLSMIRYRAGTWSTMLEAMIRRLTVPVDPDQPIASYSLHKLTTRESDDPAIALLDAWATVGDVLTFYQERIANEGYLRTATERRSVLELGRLVGYTLKPGVSASVYLAYTLEDPAIGTIPTGSKAQSTPGAGEQPQMFETSEAIDARGAWNALLPRMSRPQDITIDNVLTIPSLWVSGTTTRFEKRDPLLFAFDLQETQDRTTQLFALRRHVSTNVDSVHDRTEVVLEKVRPYYLALFDELQKFIAGAKSKEAPEDVPPGKKSAKKKAAERATIPRPTLEDARRFRQFVLLGVPRLTLMAIAERNFFGGAVRKAIDSPDTDFPFTLRTKTPNFNLIVSELIKSRGVAPASQWDVSRSFKQVLGESSDYRARLLTSFYPRAADSLYLALANNASGDIDFAQFRGVHLLHRRAAVFGYNAPTILFENYGGQNAPPRPPYIIETDDVLYLDTPDEAITNDSFVLTTNDDGAVVTHVLDASTQSRTAYAISGRTARLALSGPWWRADQVNEDPPAIGVISTTSDGQFNSMLTNLHTIRNTAVFAESEQLKLAQQPVDRNVGKKVAEHEVTNESEMRIELDRVFDGLAPGRWVIVSGERFDTTGTSGVISAELAMIANIEQNPDAGAGGTAYSTLVLVPKGLAFEYKRATVKIYANVVKATNGETRSEILGAGDAAQALQTFKLHQSPLTFVSAPTVAGVVSTLAVRVNDVLWHETDTLADASPADRVFVTKTDDDAKVSVIFGNGREGARLPTGSDNVRTTYRSSIGIGGNVRAGQIVTAISRPLGVKDVINPIEASGGADPESRDDARRNIPVSLQAMGRVVSVSDYADFARTFAAVSKASAVMLSDGRKRFVHLTIGGAGDIEIDETSDAYRNLVEALRKFGDPYQPFLVAMREKIVLAGSANVRVDPDYLWTDVAPRIRAALVDTFSYDHRDFAQPIYPSEVVATIQNVPGVVYVDLDALGGIKANQLIQLPTQTTSTTTAGRNPNEPKLPALKGINPITPRLAHKGPRLLHAAQLAYLPKELADLFILTEIKS